MGDDNNTGNEDMPGEDDNVNNIPEAVDELCFIVQEASDGYLSIHGYNIDSKCSSNVIIPEQIGGKTVKYILAKAFYDVGLSSVQIPNTVVSIGRDAFVFNGLEKVEIPSSVTFIDNWAFSGNDLKSVTINNIEENVTMGSSVFGEFNTDNIIWNN